MHNKIEAAGPSEMGIRMDAEYEGTRSSPTQRDRSVHVPLYPVRCSDVLVLFRLLTQPLEQLESEFTSPKSLVQASSLQVADMQTSLTEMRKERESSSDMMTD